MITLSKICVRCKSDKPLTEFYVRSGVDEPTDPGHYNSECKACLKERNKTQKHLGHHVPRAQTEIIAMNILRANGIACLPGKAVRVADVDVVAWGHVYIEVKYARLEFRYSTHSFVFGATLKQMQRGFLAHIVMLICDYGDRMTYHFFEADHEVFYIDGRVKHGFEFTPGQMEQIKHKDTRVKLTQPIMDEHENCYNLIWKYVRQISEDLKRGA